MRMSVVIPVYEMHGRGVLMLEGALRSLEQQTFRDFEIVIADNSQDDKIYDFCEDYTLCYYRNDKRGMAVNTNFAMSKAGGELIKILYQDDRLASPASLQVISDAWTKDTKWLITACSNNFRPHWSKYNTLGSPSCLTIENLHVQQFDESLRWMLDLEYYKRLYKRFGPPKILNTVGVIMGLGPWQETNHLSDKLKYEEHARVVK